MEKNAVELKALEAENEENVSAEPTESVDHPCPKAKRSSRTPNRFLITVWKKL